MYVRSLWIAVLVCAVIGFCLAPRSVIAQEPAITPAATIDQAKLEAGQYPLPQVLRSGQRFFNTPYLPYSTITGAAK